MTVDIYPRQPWEPPAEGHGPKEAMSGHPTAAGYPDDPGPARMGFDTTDSGIPGFPHIRPSLEGHGHGAPGQMPSGPFQPPSQYPTTPDDMK